MLFCALQRVRKFQPNSCSKYGLSAYQWLSWISQKENKFIQHKFNKREKKLTDQSLEVDGFVKETNEVRQFDGCFFIDVYCVP